MKRSSLFAAALLAACSDPEADAKLAVKEEITTRLDELVAASTALAAAAPAADADGWNATSDAAAVASMKAEWKKARIAYERVEGAIAVLFPDLDAATDERYDGFVADAKDDNLFDDQIVTGVHGIERILWANEHPEHVVAFESALEHYSAAAFPTTAAEAEAFKTKLAAKLVADATRMRNDFAPLVLDSAAAFRGVIGSLEEQLEKVHLASTGEDESRYAKHTLADMRANLEGGKATYEAFSAWVLSKDGGEDVDTAIRAGFGRVEAHYATLTGEAIPAVPDGWSDTPSAEQLATPYGKLFTLLSTEADPKKDGSLVQAMSKAADLLSIPQLPE